MTGVLLGQSKGLADGGVQVDGQRPSIRSGTGGPRPGQQLPAHPIQLAHVAPPETAQEGAQGGRRLDHAADGASGPAGAQHVGVVNAIAPSQRRSHQGHHLVTSIGSARGAAQVNVAVDQLGQTQALGQGDRQEQSGIGHQAMIIKGNLNAVGALRW